MEMTELWSNFESETIAVVLLCDLTMGPLRNRELFIIHSVLLKIFVPTQDSLLITVCPLGSQPERQSV